MFSKEKDRWVQKLREKEQMIVEMEEKDEDKTEEIRERIILCE
jgi:hypothetical protein